MSDVQRGQARLDKDTTTITGNIGYITNKKNIIDSSVNND